MGLFGNRLKYVNIRSWRTDQPGFEFPEVSDPTLRYEHLTPARRRLGLCFSGGGTRSASATLGQLRALRELGLIEQFGYLSCVSGGSWAAVPYTYLGGLANEDTFLGRYVPPERVTPESLEHLDRNGFAAAIADSVIFDNFLGHAARLAGDETYSRAIGDTFLEPFGIDSLRRFFTLDSGSLADILGRNKHMRKRDFYRVRRNRPFLIAGGTVLRRENPRPKRRLHFEMTPLYAGTYVRHSRAGSGSRDFGGGYVEAFGFDSSEPERVRKDVAKVRLGASRHRFTLSDVVGTSGAAPAEVLDQLHLSWLGFPEFRYWSPAQRRRSAREYEFGDGGILENLGMMPLLLRGCERIIAFVNTKHPLRGPRDINDSIPALFGRDDEYLLNRVFPRDDYKAVVKGLLDARRAGGPTVFGSSHTTVDNRHFGVEGGKQVEVLWVYNERAKNWEDRLPPATQALLDQGSLTNFPHYDTFFQNPPKVIDLSRKQVAMLASLASWGVMQSEVKLREFLS